MKNYALLAAFAATALLYSCSKDEGGTASTKTQMLTAKSYKLTDLLLDSAGQSQSIYAYTDSCERDNLHKFNANNTYTVTDAGIACNPSSSETGTWSFLNNETKLRTISATDTLTADITTLNATTLKLKTSDPSFPGYNIIIVYTAQ